MIRNTHILGVSFIINAVSASALLAQSPSGSNQTISWFPIAFLIFIALFPLGRIFRPISNKILVERLESQKAVSNNGKKYANKTCYDCGAIASADSMYKCEVDGAQIDGRSRKSVNAMTFFGAAVGHKKSQGAIGSWLFSTSNRRSKSTVKLKSVWKCRDCAGFQVFNYVNDAWNFIRLLKFVIVNSSRAILNLIK